jgi:anti-sigma factor RsiW
MMTDELTCKQLVEIVTEFLEGTLPRETRQRFDAHLNVCAPCRTYLEQMRKTIALTGRLREEDLEPETKNRLLDLFRQWNAG